MANIRFECQFVIHNYCFLPKFISWYKCRTCMKNLCVSVIDTCTTWGFFRRKLDKDFRIFTIMKHFHKYRMDLTNLFLLTSTGTFGTKINVQVYGFSRRSDGQYDFEKYFKLNCVLHSSFGSWKLICTFNQHCLNYKISNRLQFNSSLFFWNSWNGVALT